MSVIKIKHRKKIWHCQIAEFPRGHVYSAANNHTACLLANIPFGYVWPDTKYHIVKLPNFHALLFIQVPDTIMLILPTSLRPDTEIFHVAVSGQLAASNPRTSSGEVWPYAKCYSVILSNFHVVMCNLGLVSVKSPNFRAFVKCEQIINVTFGQHAKYARSHVKIQIFQRLGLSFTEGFNQFHQLKWSLCEMGDTDKTYEVYVNMCCPSLQIMSDYPFFSF